MDRGQLGGAQRRNGYALSPGANMVRPLRGHPFTKCFGGINQQDIAPGGAPSFSQRAGASPAPALFFLQQHPFAQQTGPVGHARQPEAEQGPADDDGIKYHAHGIIEVFAAEGGITGGTGMQRVAG
jgi:hypothetical protein